MQIHFASEGAELLFMLFMVGGGFGFTFWLTYGPVFSGEDVGSVDSGPAPRGIDGARPLNVRVRRSRGGRRFSNIRVVFRGGAIAHGEPLDRAQGLTFASILEDAAKAARDPAPAERGMGAVARIAVDVVGDGGQGWVMLTWSFGRQGRTPLQWATCLRPAAATRLAELVRIACQPGERLADAKRNWWRERDRRKREAAPGSPEKAG